MAAEKLSFRLEKFNGPLDLLLHLIEKNKVNIFDIPIAEITDQYMAYLQKMQEEDLDVMSEFLLMAATLLDIKSRMLLPREENEEAAEEEDPREELVQRLLAYKKYRLMAEGLEDREFDASRVLYREASIPKEVAAWQQPPDLEALFQGVTLPELRRIFEDVMRRCANRVDPERSRFGTIRRERVSMRSRLTSLLGYARKHRKFSFRNLLPQRITRTEVVVTFLAVLELMKAGKIHAAQNETDGDISIETDEHAFDTALDPAIAEEFGE